MRIRGWLVVLVLATATRAARADLLPTWPAPVLKDGETALKGVFPSTVRWLSGDGTAVTFQAISIGSGKHKQVLLRATYGTTQQDLATSDLPDAEFFIFDHEAGNTAGLQLHRYVAGPDLYEGWIVKWTGKKLDIAKTTHFNGKQPQPHWLVDTDDVPYSQRMRHGMKVLRWGAHRSDLNAFAHYFDGEPVKATWRTGTGTRDETISGTELLHRLQEGLPLVGHNATCKALCCTSDTKALAAWRHIETICFDAEPKDVLAFPHVRSIEIVEP